MAVLKHFSINNSPLATLKYIVGETKKHKAAIVTGLKCSEDPESAYMEMAMCYEHFAGEKFHRVGNPTGKEHLKMHHYVISFKGVGGYSAGSSSNCRTVGKRDFWR